MVKSESETLAINLLQKSNSIKNKENIQSKIEETISKSEAIYFLRFREQEAQKLLYITQKVEKYF